ncbi:MAG: hypothetical protein A3C02_00115 [Candidatus Andersenbacteria bacterium RIFCSPHIGHO2_02_FULL_45_11]|uniref:Glycosyltransferase 2-like domain-containing protein n=1 Tax=Candidatus Andersenbacteria bacterium RIFCSPHIGHO2_12_FULL_45_11 TaxID=1797281 RepID=A0A1G1X2Z2_9BACT|nr:MAG: hypothetical protein A2805_02080 [Candidatus Andersenbacteria bacterium RIFCSPHIGHO2_01_FULL_46_36]OGY31960.1 MAG: hypothetical protein A3C02_00115 [Candidatus Andersenbacteria bacterium RIFCSPHIGHO2_02_FULL_45_11]OGY34171.1 MAG: hypothetical protein A3D99_00435 [Candidatus Andersenbacteria bacterium RIFCSPHIGHO2_12_FULL_45_11]QBM02290.1 hypothetical protein [uncultured archaeon]
MNPRLTIQVVGWNSSRHLRETLAALSEIPSEQAVIRYIDNGSEDHSVEMVRDLLPNAEIIQLDANTGFARPHNLGFSKCTTPYVLTLDPDISLVWEGMEKLLNEMDKNPKLGAVQGKLYRRVPPPYEGGVGGGELQRLRRTPPNLPLKRGGAVLDSAGIVQTLALNGKERGSSEPERGQYEQPAALLAVTGGCGLYRMQALRAGKTLGVNAKTPSVEEASEIFDKDFFAYKEDVDLGWRLNKAGWEVGYIPVLVGYHARTMGRRGIFNWGITPAAISGRVSNMRSKYSLRNYTWMLAKNMTWKQEIIHAPFILIRLAVFFILSLFSPQLFAAWGEAHRGMGKILAKRSGGDGKTLGVNGINPKR